MISLRDDLQRLLIARRNERAARLALVEELVLSDLKGLRVMRDENDLDVAVAGRDELVEQKEEAAREILFHRVHRARGVHDAHDGRVRFLANVGLEMLVAQVILMERKTTLVAVGVLGRFEPLGFAAMLRRQHSLDALARRALREIQSDYSSRRKGYRKVGIRIRLDKRRTAKQRVMRMLASEKRNDAVARALEESKADHEIGADADVVGALDEIALEEGKLDDASLDEQDLAPSPATAAFQRVRHRYPFHQNDLRYKHVEIDTKEESNAAVICIMDTSGSMDTMKKYLARSFFFLLYQFISTRYRNVEIVFIAHHTEASEVTEEEFFHKGESGGTFISSGYAKALEIIAARYHPSLWNLYAFHCSDGDNFDSDNPAALKDAEELAEICNLFGYGEIKPMGSRYYESSMLNVFRRIQAPNFHTVLIERKEDIWPSFRAFLSKDRAKLADAGNATPA